MALLFVCLCVLPSNVARQHVPMATNTHGTIAELLDAVFSMQSVSYQIFKTQ
jgi:hypothetical protein